jgi:hypothetical protein
MSDNTADDTLDNSIKPPSEGRKYPGGHFEQRERKEIHGEHACRSIPTERRHNIDAQDTFYHHFLSISTAGIGFLPVSIIPWYN